VKNDQEKLKRDIQKRWAERLAKKRERLLHQRYKARKAYEQRNPKRVNKWYKRKQLERKLKRAEEAATGSSPGSERDS
jgi:hypothetical protein